MMMMMMMIMFDGVEKRTLPFVAQAAVGAPGLAWNSR